MVFAKRYTKPGASMSNYNMPRPAGSVIGPPRLQGPSVNSMGASTDQTDMQGIFNNPALKLSAAPKKSPFGFGRIGKSK